MTDCDVQKICRTCLGNRIELIPLDKTIDKKCYRGSGSLASKTLGEMLMELANIEFKSDDGLPRSVCLQCISALRAALAYKEMCEESDVKLRQIFPHISTDSQAISSTIAKSVAQEAVALIREVPIDPLEEHWFEEGASDTFESELFASDDHLLMQDEDACDMKPSTVTNNDLIQNNEESNIVARAQCVDDLWPCELCQKSFADRKSLKLHVRMHFAKKSERYPASCAQPNHSDPALEPESRQRRFQIGALDIGASLSMIEGNILTDNHERRLGSMQQHFNCKQCGSDFDSFDSLVHHTAEAHQQFDCDICGKTLATLQNLERHKQTHDPNRPNADDVGEQAVGGKKANARKFTCGVCERKFSFKGNLKTHMQTHYPDMNAKQAVLCIHCGKMVKANMAIHMRRHSGEKPFKCDICGKAFITQTYMTEHRRVHTGEKAYTCRSCGRGFNRATRYAEHMRVHGLYAENRPYSCANCDRRFSQVKYLKRHICPNTGNQSLGAQSIKE